MYKLLIVDDEFLVQTGLRSLIDYKEMNISLTGVAKNGEEALQMIHSQHPDIVLLDIKMPKMTGIEVMEQLQGAPDAPLFIILTNHDDFDYARTAIRLGAFDYIMKVEISEPLLRKVLSKAIEKLSEKNDSVSSLTTSEIVLRDQFYLRHLNNMFPSEDILQENIEALGLEIGTDYAVVYFLCPQASSFQESNLKTISYLSSMITGAFEQYYTCYVTPWNFSSFAIIADLTGKEVDFLRTCAEKAVQMASQYINIELRAGVGEVVPFKDIPASFSNAIMIANECTEANPVKCFFEMSEDHQRRLRPAFNLATIDNHLKEAVDSFNITEIHALFELIHQFYSRRDNMLSQGIITISGLLHFISVSFSESDKMLYQLFPGADDPYYALEHVRSVKEVVACTDHIEKVICDRVEHDFERSKNWIVPNIKKYIEDNYDKSLSLNDVAEAFDISAGYISTLFKKNNDGVGFSECVTQAKIIKAKQLLTETRMKIYEISDAVGYNDPYYFSKMFKKVTGYSPKEYASQFHKDLY